MTNPLQLSQEEISKLPPGGGAEYNRLIFESSPYLLQHAANPVDWHPWGPEAFDLARQQDKPVFLSIGYATCHWCHVMEHESFEDPETAALMNDTFICIKVDREERPDIDSVYMTVTQALTGQGGWPMTVLLTPDKLPFFAGTYFPREGRFGRPGMKDLVPQIDQIWKEDRQRILESADSISTQLARINTSEPGEGLNEIHLKKAFEELRDRFDPFRGGFSDRPKFPVPHNLSCLLRHHHRTGDAEALNMVEKTLVHMRHGGIFDHVGFGFHRYSTDEMWLLPHFEKMLYDQALLVRASVEAWLVTGKDEYQRTAMETLQYVTRDMTHPEGGFFSAEDADSEGEEGKFYVWSTAEVIELLGREEGELYADIYGFEEEGNFADEATHQRTGVNIPHLAKPLFRRAEDLKIPLHELEERLEKSRSILFEERKKRIHPLKDDKILTDWNGLMIGAFARAGAAFDKAEYLDTARAAASFILEKVTHEGRLLKRWRNGQAGLPAHLEDYAFMAWGLSDLYEATLETRWLSEAAKLVAILLEDFWDEEGGAFFQVAHSGEALIVRNKEFYDGAIPAGNSAAALVLLRLGRLLGREDWEARADALFRTASSRVSMGAGNFTLLMSALDFALGETSEVILAGDSSHPEFVRMLRTFNRAFRPGSVLLHLPAGGDKTLLELAPWLDGYTAGSDGAPLAYVCRNHACEKPVSTAKELEVLLRNTA